MPSIVGSFSKKLFPVSEIAGSNFDIDMQIDTIINALVCTPVPQSMTLTRLRLNVSVVEYNNTITEVIRRSYNSTYVIPCTSIQSYSYQFTTSTAGNFTWTINATLMNAKGLLFVFQDAGAKGQDLYSLSSRTSLGMKEAQLSVGSYTFPANRFLSTDCATALVAGGIIGSNQVNYWMSAMKFFGVGIDNNARCSTNRVYFNVCCEDGKTEVADGTFALAFNLEGLHENDDEFRSCQALDGTTTQLNFTTGLPAVATTTCICFILYEFDVVISQGTALATNKYNDFSNQQTK